MTWLKTLISGWKQTTTKTKIIAGVATVIVVILGSYGAYMALNGNSGGNGGGQSQQDTQSLPEGDYEDLKAKLLKYGLYENKDGSIGGVFTLSNGSNMRVVSLGKDGNLVGAVEVEKDKYKLYYYSYSQLKQFLDRKESVQSASD